ncbi:hypothetical protein GCM10010215_26590 [Streptomyces virginiae]|uniref:CdaR GGDEF-like domain-containing protein n=1 Tax=Streptomyces virginiae TaxID=1961 RepID=A0ABQ3NN30_STRVG|nr:hypothetical protein GCM10010215_26590 [Streptomyces virginiae]GHI14162.1 hypothetical protein Scinn_36250 [Streptomyces virginiae]
MHDGAGSTARQLTGYVECLRDACTTGRRMTRTELEARRAEGERAAELGLTLRVMICEHRAVSQEVLTRVPIQQAGSLLAVSEQAIDALVEGYERAQHQAVRQEEAARREFIDDLLYGRSDLGRLAERAERFGLRLSQAHAVAVASGPEPYGDGYPVARGIESAVLSRFTGQQILLTTMDGRLICVAPRRPAGCSGVLRQAGVRRHELEDAGYAPHALDAEAGGERARRATSVDEGVTA